MESLKLAIKNFRGIKEGSLNFEELNILVGGNNSGKTTVLEASFLSPNPLRYIPYVRGVSAIGILNSLHSTLGEAHAFLFYDYSSDSANITCSNEYWKSKVEFCREGEEIGVYVEEENVAYYLGYLSRSSKDIWTASGLVIADRDEKGKLRRTGSEDRSSVYFVSEKIGEVFYFHPTLMKRIWDYFKDNWIDFRNAGLTVKVAESISEGIAERYDDLLLEPFVGGSQTIYARRAKDAHGIRLGDMGDGTQVFVTLMLLCEFSRPKILLIDDIESHINPALLMHITSWLGDILDNGTRLIISTHSLETAKFIADVLEEYKTQIILLALREGILGSKNLSLEGVENLERAGIDIRMSEGVLL